MQAYDKLDQYITRYAFSTWLYKIADNLALRQLSKNKKVVLFDPSMEVLDDAPPRWMSESIGQLANEIYNKPLLTCRLTIVESCRSITGKDATTRRSRR